jgi:hypothetical protein
MQHHWPWKVGGKLPKVRVSNSTESILYFAVFSSIIGLATSCAVLQIAYRIKNIKHSMSIRDSEFMLRANEKIQYLVKIGPHQLQKPVQPINLKTRKKWGSKCTIRIIIVSCYLILEAEAYSIIVRILDPQRNFGKDGLQRFWIIFHKRTNFDILTSK